MIYLSYINYFLHQPPYLTRSPNQSMTEATLKISFKPIICASHTCAQNPQQTLQISQQDIITFLLVVNQKPQSPFKLSCNCNINIMTLKEMLHQKCKNNGCENILIDYSKGNKSCGKTQYCFECYRTKLNQIELKQQSILRKSQEINQLKAQYNELKRQNDELISQNQQHQNSQRETLAKKQELQRKILLLQQQTDTHKKQTQRIQTEMSQKELTYQQRILNHQEENQKNLIQIKTLTQRIQSVLKQPNQEIEELREKRKKIISLAEEKQKLIDQIKQLQKQNSQNKNTIKQLKRDGVDLIAATNQIEKLKQANQQLKSKYENYRSKFKSLPETNSHEIQKLKEQNQSLQLKIQDLLEEKNTLLSLKQTNKLREKQASDEVQAKKQSSNTQSQTQKFLKQKFELEHKIKQREHRIDQLQNQLKLQKTKQHNLKQHYENLDKSFAGFMSSYRTFARQIQNPTSNNTLNENELPYIKLQNHQSTGNSTGNVSSKNQSLKHSSEESINQFKGKQQTKRIFFDDQQVEKQIPIQEKPSLQQKYSQEKNFQERPFLQQKYSQEKHPKDKKLLSEQQQTQNSIGSQSEVNELSSQSQSITQSQKRNSYEINNFDMAISQSDFNARKKQKVQKKNPGVHNEYEKGQNLVERPKVAQSLVQQRKSVTVQNVNKTDLPAANQNKEIKKKKAQVFLTEEEKVEEQKVEAQKLTFFDKLKMSKMKQLKEENKDEDKH